MDDEQRTFLRIPTKLRARLRLVATETEPQLFREAPIVSSSVTAMELKNSGMHEALVNALMNIDRKLDMLIGLHASASLEDDFPQACEVVEISGAGIKGISDRPLPVGQLAEVVITLTQLPIRMAAAIGVVLREETEEGRFAWALDFTKIRDRDLESIVQFVFQTQRDEMRGKKWT